MSDTQVRYQLSVRDTAVQLGISEGAVRQRIRRGSLEARRKGRRVLVLLTEADVAAEGYQDEDELNHTVRIVQAPDETLPPAQNGTISRAELDQANAAYDDLAEAWARDLRRQLERLENEVERLLKELSETRERHAEEMRRKDILLQGNQEALMTSIARIAGPAAQTPPESE